MKVIFISILTLLVCCQTFSTQNFSLPSFNALFIGDSVDRNIVLSLCELYGEKDAPLSYKTSSWGANRIRYDDGTKMGTAFCQFSEEACEKFRKNITLAFLHIFGSANGPYLYVKHDGFTPTQRRIKYAIDVYHELKKRRLNTIYYNSVIWDMRLLFVYGSPGNTSRAFKNWVKENMKNTHSRVQEIVNHPLVQEDGTQVLLRTAPYSDAIDDDCVDTKKCLPTGHACIELNRKYFHIAKSLNISIFDFDAFAWDKVGGAQHRERMGDIYIHRSARGVDIVDKSHPSFQVSMLAGMSMLGLDRQVPHSLYLQSSKDFGKRTTLSVYANTKTSSNLNLDHGTGNTTIDDVSVSDTNGFDAIVQQQQAAITALEARVAALENFTTTK